MSAITKVSAKGQVVIPHDVRSALGLRAGQALEVTQVGGGVLLTPVVEKSGRSFDEIVRHIRSIVRYDGPPSTIEEMNESIADGWRASALRSDRARD